MKWKPKHEKAARQKAWEVALLIKREGNLSLEKIAKEFSKSKAWASVYRRLAKEYGYVTEFLSLEEKRELLDEIELNVFRAIRIAFEEAEEVLNKTAIEMPHEMRFDGAISLMSQEFVARIRIAVAPGLRSVMKAIPERRKG